MKPCTKCGTTKPFAEFAKRTASKDGLTAACKFCINAAKELAYHLQDGEREKTLARVAKNKLDRFERDPAYKRAFNLWGSTRKRTTLLPWTKITDFLPICRRAVKKGDGYVLDHIVPLNHPDVCGLHVPWNLKLITEAQNQKKGNSFAG